MGSFAVRAEHLGKRYRLGRVESGYRQVGRLMRRESRSWK